ncbi:NUDIX hydrolase [Rhabdothermincola salaria]|uniref:NUDIX hydrolase n=1 Tax=Rhabdothermincola salaria TaxID=2903142 RepID=UPI001E350404|nr:NUDIX domain-containing protein [Rhabdothermincola salaria]
MTARPELSVAAVVVHDGMLLVVRRGHGPAAGEWSVPGGRVEHGETLAEAVVREVAEETGLECICGELLGWVEVLDDRAEGHHHVILDFVATVLDHREPRAGDDAAEAAWVPLGDVAQLNLVDGLAEFLHDNGVLDTIV